MSTCINKAAKDFMRSKFREWYATQVQQQLHEGEDIAPVDLRMSIMKPLGAHWLVSLYDYLKEHPSIIQNGFYLYPPVNHLMSIINSEKKKHNAHKF